METGQIIELIGTFGFPIASAIALAWYVVNTNRENNARIDRLQEDHKAEIAKFTDALNNNTIALNELCDKLSK